MLPERACASPMRSGSREARRVGRCSSASTTSSSRSPTRTPRPPSSRRRSGWRPGGGGRHDRARHVQPARLAGRQLPRAHRRVRPAWRVGLVDRRADASGRWMPAAASRPGRSPADDHRSRRRAAARAWLDLAEPVRATGRGPMAGSSAGGWPAPPMHWTSRPPAVPSSSTIRPAPSGSPRNARSVAAGPARLERLEIAVDDVDRASRAFTALARSAVPALAGRRRSARHRHRPAPPPTPAAATPRRGIGPSPRHRCACRRIDRLRSRWSVRLEHPARPAWARETASAARLTSGRRRSASPGSARGAPPRCPSSGRGACRAGR